MEFKDILIGSPMPLHPYMIGNVCLSIRLTVDGKFHSDTPFVYGDLKNGIWEMNSGLCVPEDCRSITLVIVANKGGNMKQIVAAKLNVSDTLAQIKFQPEGYYELATCDSCSPIQVIMSCSIRVSLSSFRTSSSPDRTHGREGNASDPNKENPEAKPESKKLLLPSKPMESSYAKLHPVSEQNIQAYKLNAIGCAHHTRTGGIADLEKAIFVHEKAVHLTSGFHPQFPKYSSDLGITLCSRFDRNADPADIDKAISLCQKAVELTNHSESEKPARLNALGACHLTRFKQLGEAPDLNQAISACQGAARLLPNAHPNEASIRNNLGAAFSMRFEYLGILADLEQAISLKQTAVDLMPQWDPNKPSLLANLGSALSTRFEYLGNLADLEQAISLQQIAMELMPERHPNKAYLLASLGSSFSSRFECIGSLADLQQAISLKQSALDLMQNGHPDRPSLLMNIGTSLFLRFEQLGSLADLEQAISLEQQAVNLTPDGHPDKLSLFMNTGASLLARFKHLGSVSDLERAIALLQTAMDSTPEEHPEAPFILSNLASALESRFESLGSLVDLEQAISLNRRAVDLTPEEHIDKPSRLSNLGASFLSRFERLGSPPDLEQAILLKQKVVVLTPDGNPAKPIRMTTLGSALYARFERFGDLVDLEQTIALVQGAVDLTPDGHPYKPFWTHDLGAALKARFMLTRVPDDLENAISAFATAAGSHVGTPIHRFNSARAWADILNECFRSTLPAFECAINLLPRVAWLGLKLTDQHAVLARIGDVVRDAVAAAIELEEYETAVEWAEQGRSIVWQNMLGLRNPLDSLRDAHPELAARLQSISQQLEWSTNRDSLSGKDNTPLEDVARRSSKLAIEWDNLVGEIRKTPDFESFLGAKALHELAPASNEGPVIILNVQKGRCDALILIPDDSNGGKGTIANVPLEGLSYEVAEELSRDLTSILSSAGLRARDIRQSERVGHSHIDNNVKFRSILYTLWLHVAQPIISSLAYPVQAGNLPRIWWCATGPLAFLPIHAAGNYDESAVGEKLSDYVVSSYTPTLTAMLEQSRPVVQKDFQILTVSQPSTPYATPLPGTEDEVKRVKDLATAIHIESLSKEKATVGHVLQAMKKSQWIHLACHGQQNSDNSMKSGFLLHDKILELSEIVKEPLPKADFAFLSACQTATGDEKVMEESVHLAAGMLFSGCRGVIATMWSINDGDAPQVAEDVYRRMLKDGTAQQEGGGACPT